MTFRWRLLGRADCLGAAAKARDCLTRAGWPSRDASELAVVVAELASNAIRYAGGGECLLELEARAWTVTVNDEGPGFPALILQDGGRADPAEIRTGLGAGLSSARRLAGQLKLENLKPKGARVVARRQLSNQGAV